MLQLLYMMIFLEMAVIMTLVFKSPIRKLVLLTLDHVKRGSGSVVVKTVAGTVAVVMLSGLYSIGMIHNRRDEGEFLTPTDQILMGQHMLEVSLMGFMLFLSLLIDRIHHYIRELRLLRKTMEAVKKQSKAVEDGKSDSGQQVKRLGEEVAALQAKIKNLESECEAKAKEARDAESEVEALKKRSEALLLKYDGLIEDNQNLKNQLETMD